ncbi:hypothetical protein M3F63_04700 [Brachybacterium muris]|uniref:hypothetical protein n=1 Tax=Brachybacterium muris TaxID=219301 RepID=UPI00223AA524|nr:hypothetical protein [Brachybacterium muris]MCT2176970.1 hypothetical protein [Brachybacterium muris]
MSSTLVIVPRGHWMNAWFLGLCAVPVISVDGQERTGRWGMPTEITVEPGTRTVAVGAHYRGTRPVLGAQDTTIEVGPGQQLTVEARNGLVNHEPFTVTAERK